MEDFDTKYCKLNIHYLSKYSYAVWLSTNVDNSVTESKFLTITHLLTMP